MLKYTDLQRLLWGHTVRLDVMSMARHHQKCGCNKCEGRGGGNSGGGNRRNNQSNWEPRGSQPPDVGTIAGTDHVVSFKTKGDETLIADGDFSDDKKGFDRNPDGSKAHDHHGPSGSKDRGKYTGPGH